MGVRNAREVRCDTAMPDHLRGRFGVHSYAHVHYDDAGERLWRASIRTRTHSLPLSFQRAVKERARASCAREARSKCAVEAFGAPAGRDAEQHALCATRACAYEGATLFCDKDARRIPVRTRISLCGTYTFTRDSRTDTGAHARALCALRSASSKTLEIKWHARAY